MTIASRKAVEWADGGYRFAEKRNNEMEDGKKEKLAYGITYEKLN